MQAQSLYNQNSVFSGFYRLKCYYSCITPPLISKGKILAKRGVLYTRKYGKSVHLEKQEEARVFRLRLATE